MGRVDPHPDRMIQLHGDGAEATEQGQNRQDDGALADKFEFLNPENVAETVRPRKR